MKVSRWTQRAPSYARTGKPQRASKHSHSQTSNAVTYGYGMGGRRVRTLGPSELGELGVDLARLGDYGFIPCANRAEAVQRALAYLITTPAIARASTGQWFALFEDARIEAVLGALPEVPPQHEIKGVKFMRHPPDWLKAKLARRRR